MEEVVQGSVSQLKLYSIDEQAQIENCLDDTECQSQLECCLRTWI
jgi:hypothetical protein